MAVPILTIKLSSPDYLTTSAAMPYSFRNLFRIRGNKLGIPSPTRLLEPTYPGESIFLASPIGHRDIQEDHEVVLAGSAYASFDAALQAGRKWRQIVQSTFARQGIACEFGDDAAAKLSPPRLTVDHTTGLFDLTPTDLLYDDRVGLLVFDAYPIPKFIFMYGGTPIVSMSPPSADCISAAVQRNSSDWSDELRLAYTLVHSAMADTNPETRFILMVTAIEALIPYGKKEDALSQMLEALRPKASGMTSFDEDTRKVVDGLLKSSQYNSIRQYGLKLAGRLSGTYAGLAAKKYYDEAYGTRSALAHGSLRDTSLLTKDALEQRFSELRRFVLDILESWTAGPSFSDE